jgi:MoaA/NifB/PqqE/SkfB family radical SAM enzyme
MTGGEPVVRPDFFEISSTPGTWDSPSGSTRTAIWWTARRARKLKEIHTFEVEISIHGAKAETHDRLTGIRGSFDRVISALENLQKYRIKTNLKCPITHLNQDELWGIWDIATRFGTSISFDPVITPRDDGDKSPLGMAATKDFLVKFFSDEYKGYGTGDVTKRDDTVVGPIAAPGAPPSRSIPTGALPLRSVAA